MKTWLTVGEAATARESEPRHDLLGVRSSRNRHARVGGWAIRPKPEWR
jgi:hypothetical protein